MIASRFFLHTLLTAMMSSALFAQAENKPYIDIHVNASDKAFNSRTLGKFSIWEPIYHDCSPERSTKFMSLYGERFSAQSQSHLEALRKGNVGLAMLSVSPIEQGVINSSSLLAEADKRATIRCITGIISNQLFLRRTEVDYFDELVQNVEFLQRAEANPYYYRGEKLELSLIRRKEDIDYVLEKSNMMGFFLTIEGGHSIGHSIYVKGGLTELPEYRDLVLDNVKRLKGTLPFNSSTGEYLRVPVLWMSLCKTFDNGLGGEALSLSGGQQNALSKSASQGKGLSRLGVDVVKELISSNGRRILVDIKHMSLEARRNYYQIVESAGILGKVVPIVCSHAGISNLSWKTPLYKSKDSDDKNNNSYLNHWEQNLAAEDVFKIYQTGGLLGLTLDKRVLAGQLAINEIEASLPNSLQRRQACLKVFAANVLTVIDIVGDKKAWDMICLGSDFDAMQEPLDPYYSAAQIPDLAYDLQRFFEKPEAIGDLFTPEDIKRLMFDYSAEELVQKLLHDNALNFARKNFDDTKLRGRRMN